MQSFTEIGARPEAMADVPGVCELPLTRAIVQYRDVHEVGMAGGGIRDIGLALVLEGRFASSAEVIDLGSADVKVLDLSGELVVLDWVYDPTLEHAQALVRAAATAAADPGRSVGESGLSRFCFRLALRVLERSGFGPLTRPILLRLGFRDVCRDLDLHEGTSVRISVGSRGVVRVHLDYDANALVVRTPTAREDAELERALSATFPTASLRRLVPESGAAAATGGYQLRFPLPLTLGEVREELAAVRSGLAGLMARFEPERFRSVERMTDTFGARETLARLHLRGGAPATAPVDRGAAAGSAPGSGRVH